MSILSFLTRKPSPPSPSEAARTLSMRTQRSRDAREHEKRKAEMTAQLRAEIAAYHARKAKEAQV